MIKILSYFKGDRYIWWIILGLTAASLISVYSATGTLAYKHYEGDTLHYLLRHGAQVTMGLIILFAIHKIDFIWYKRLSVILMWASVPLLIFTLVSGASLNHASRWIMLPGIGISFQTSDLAKFSLIIYVARYLTNNQDIIKDLKKGFLPIIASIAGIVGLIIYADFSTAAMLFLITSCMLYIGRVRIIHLGSVFFLGFVLVAFLLLLSPYLSGFGRIGTWANRIERFVDSDEKDEGNFQAEQSLIAVVKGGFLGKGPGGSEQRNFLPHPYSDFIFAIIIEEYGLWGASLIIAAYIALFYRIGKTVVNSSSSFGAFLALGIGLSLVIQAFINMGVAVGLLPVTGQTLPLVSMGGTSLLFTSISLGILLNVSQQCKKNKNNE